MPRAVASRTARRPRRGTHHPRRSNPRRPGHRRTSRRRAGASQSSTSSRARPRTRLRAPARGGGHGDDGAMSTTRPMLTQREAATACGVSRTTIRRREDGDLPGAVQDPKRGWLIPIDDLLAAGLRPHAPAPPDAPATQAGPTEDDDQGSTTTSPRCAARRAGPRAPGADDLPARGPATRARHSAARSTCSGVRVNARVARPRWPGHTSSSSARQLPGQEVGGGSAATELPGCPWYVHSK
ncbi:helix-turn-helix domain-containing protein [Streptomyces sp. NPDC087538]|uniref:helix-turn-helix domain-containing protein n=1 Tax=Streptomyces sp. NPDC087538 TaxID=3365797 RepID=UPI0038160A09